MNKMTPLKILLVWVLVISMLVLSACSGTGAIVGTWKDSLGQTMTFFKDGTVTTGGLLAMTGTYTFPDNTHLKIEFQGLGALVGAQVYEYKVSGNTLTLSTSIGVQTVYTKVK